MKCQGDRRPSAGLGRHGQPGPTVSGGHMATWVASGKESHAWQTTSSHGCVDLNSANHRELGEDECPR